jgi:hypothetical protein
VLGLLKKQSSLAQKYEVLFATFLVEWLCKRSLADEEKGEGLGILLASYFLQAIQRALASRVVLPEYMGVNLSGFYIVMTKQFLESANVCAV